MVTLWQDQHARNSSKDARLANIIEKYALNKETSTCEKCHESCLICYESFTEGSCFECPTGYFKRTSENYYYPFYTGDCTKCTSENHGDENCI